MSYEEDEVSVVYKPSERKHFQYQIHENVKREVSKWPQQDKRDKGKVANASMEFDYKPFKKLHDLV